MIPRLHFLQNDLTVTPVDDDRVQVSVVLPADCFREYAHLLDSLTGFLHLAQRQERIARSISGKQAEKLKAEAEANRQRYYQRLVKAYDHYTAQGLDRPAAIKQISADLRAENHPWASVDLVRPSLIEAGRPGRMGRPRRNP